MKEVNKDLISAVTREVCSVYNITKENLESKEDQFLLPRQVVAYLLKQEFNQPLWAIRTVLGVKSDMPAYQACKHVGELLKKDEKLRSLIQRIKTDVLTACVGTTEENDTPSSSHKKREERSKETRENVTIIETVLSEIGKIYPIAALLRATSDTALKQVNEAKDLSVFVLWKYHKVPVTELGTYFSLDANGYFLAIGRMSVFLEQDTDLAERLKRIRIALKT